MRLARLVLVVLSVLVLSLALSCGSDSIGNGDSDTDVDSDSDTDVDTDADTDTDTGCKSDGDCAVDEQCKNGICVPKGTNGKCHFNTDCDTGYCDRIAGECVECRNKYDCWAQNDWSRDFWCVHSQCVEPATCSSDLQCTGQGLLCIKEKCLECEDSAECSEGRCIGNSCIEKRPCETSLDCVDISMVCVGYDEKYCAECSQTADCPSSEICAGHDICYPDPCVGVDCSGYGTCSDERYSYPTCNCSEMNYRDDGEGHCVTPCTEGLCEPHGTCIAQSATEFDCNCEEGYFDDGDGHCVDPCAGKCESNGICYAWSAYGFACRCDDGYFDDEEGHCVSPCSPNPCGSHEICFASSITEYQCSCEEGYTRDGQGYCVNPCEGKCEPNGTCEAFSATEVVCHCDDGYFDDGDGHCVNPCDDGKCVPNGTCEAQSVTEFSCHCNEGYFDDDNGNCVNPCDNQPCSANSTCRASGFDLYECLLCPEAIAEITIPEVDEIHVADYVKLDSAASFSRSGSSLVYRWYFVEEPVGSSSALEPDTTDSAPYFAVHTIGRYIVCLEVSEAGGAKSSDNNCGGDACLEINVKPPTEDIFVELVWDHPETDVDIHYIRSGGKYGERKDRRGTAYNSPGCEDVQDCIDEFGNDYTMCREGLCVYPCASDWDCENRYGSDFLCVYDICVKNHLAGDCHFFNPHPYYCVISSTSDDPSLTIDDVRGFGPEVISHDNPCDDEYRIWASYYEDKGMGSSGAKVRVFIKGMQVAEESHELLRRNCHWLVGKVKWPEGTFEVATENNYVCGVNNPEN